MKHPTPQSPKEMERECLGSIARVAADIERCAMNGDTGELEVQFNFLKSQMNRLDVIRKTIRQAPREL